MIAAKKHRTLGGEPLNVRRLSKERGWSVVYINRALDSENPPTTMAELHAAIVWHMDHPQQRRRSRGSEAWAGTDPALIAARLTKQAPTPVYSGSAPRAKAKSTSGSMV
jgi:hypothetical protein